MQSIQNKILVVGSTNTDMVIKTSKLPAPGETVLGGDFVMNPGGKGANQAVAAQRLGGEVTFVGKVGNDSFGKQAIQSLKNEGINIDFVTTDSGLPSGIAMITVDENGENSIVVAPGANHSLSPADCNPATVILNSGSLVLLQLEVPLKTVNHVARKAAQKGAKVILNPAPAQPLTDELLQNIFLISPNKNEAGLLTGIPVFDVESAQKAAEELKKKGVQVVIITMGSSGAFVLSDEFSGMVDSPKVLATDTTAAGDTFNGALAVALSENKSLLQAVEFANHAAAIAVTRLGAQVSIPYRKELDPASF